MIAFEDLKNKRINKKNAKFIDFDEAYKCVQNEQLSLFNLI